MYFISSVLASLITVIHLYSCSVLQILRAGDANEFDLQNNVGVKGDVNSIFYVLFNLPVDRYI